MKLTVETLKGSHFEIRVRASDTSKSLGSSRSSSAQPATTAAPSSNPTPAPEASPVQDSKSTASASVSDPVTVSASTEPYGDAASNLAAGVNLEQTIQQMLDMGGGAWDKETVARALRAAYNNPARAVDYLYSPEQDMPNAVSVTPAEQEIIERLEPMGFDRALVIEAFLACGRNEELAINYLLENAGVFDD